MADCWIGMLELRLMVEAWLWLKNGGIVVEWWVIQKIVRKRLNNDSQLIFQLFIYRIGNDFTNHRGCKIESDNWNYNRKMSRNNGKWKKQGMIAGTKIKKLSSVMIWDSVQYLISQTRWVRIVAAPAVCLSVCPCSLGPAVLLGDVVAAALSYLSSFLKVVSQPNL